MKEMDRPLNSTWDVYYLRNDVGANWDDRLVKVASFGTILEFWAVYLYLKLPNQLAAVSKLLCLGLPTLHMTFWPHLT